MLQIVELDSSYAFDFTLSNIFSTSHWMILCKGNQEQESKILL